MNTVADEKWKDSLFLLGFSAICCSLCKDPTGENALFCFDDANMALYYPISISECISQIFSYLSFQ